MNKKLKIIVGILLFVFCIIVGFGWGLKKQNETTPEKKKNGVAFSAGIRWHGYDEGLARAKKEKKKIFLYFWADWCRFCERMEKETLAKPEVTSFLKDHFISIRVNSDAEQRLAVQYFVRGLPTIWFLGENGEKISNLPGYVSQDLFLPILDYIYTGSYEKMTFNEFLGSK